MSSAECTRTGKADSGVDKPGPAGAVEGRAMGARSVQPGGEQKPATRKRQRRRVLQESMRISCQWGVRSNTEQLKSRTRGNVERKDTTNSNMLHKRGADSVFISSLLKNDTSSEIFDMGLAVPKQ